MQEPDKQDADSTSPSIESTVTFDSIYGELKKIAVGHMRRESNNHSWSPTVLVHELFLKITDIDPAVKNDRRQFYSYASTAMRSLLIDHARAQKADKRGGDWQRVQLLEEPGTEQSVDLLGLDEVLGELELLDAKRAKLVELRFFAGHSMQECADILDISVPTAERWWRATRVWLFDRLSEKPNS